MVVFFALQTFAVSVYGSVDFEVLNQANCSCTKYASSVRTLRSWIADLTLSRLTSVTLLTYLGTNVLLLRFRPSQKCLCLS